MEVCVVNLSKSAVSQDVIYKNVNLILETLDKLKVKVPEKFKSLTVVFNDSNDMANLNKKFRGKDGPTDVLSFEGVDKSSLGEVVLCVDVIESRGKFMNETVLLILHGILHLLGYEHECGGEKEKIMFDLQKKAFSLILEKGICY